MIILKVLKINTMNAKNILIILQSLNITFMAKYSSAKQEKSFIQDLYFSPSFSSIILI